MKLQGGASEVVTYDTAALSSLSVSLCYGYLIEIQLN